MPKAGQIKGTPARRAELIEYLRSLGPGDECVYWPWGEERETYQRAYINGRKVFTHRWVYEQIVGPLPERHGRGATGVVVRHFVCDNPPCIRPSHLAAGSQKDNIQDAVVRGRMSSGERNGRVKISEMDVRRIVALSRQRVPQRIIAATYSISQTQVSRIVNGQTWFKLDGS